MFNQETFYQYVREIFTRLDDRPYLLNHPFAEAFAEGTRFVSPEQLREHLEAAIDQLRPPSGSPSGTTMWRRWRSLSLRYVEGCNMRRIAHELQVSERQARRDHRLGIDAVAAVLWTQYLARLEHPPSLRESASTAFHEPLTSPVLDSHDLDTEMAHVLASAATEPTSIVEAVESAMMTVHNLVESRRAHLAISLPDDLPMVEVNPSIIRHILLCLLTASVESSNGPDISLQARNVGEFVELTIRNLSRSDPSSLTEAGVQSLMGTAQHLAESQGGSLEVESGSQSPWCVVLTLPTVRFRTILVVDDNPDIGELFRRFLTGAAFRLFQARTPPTALSVAHKYPPDLIILDVMLPSQDGWQILQMLRDDEALRQTPVIVCSILPERALALSLGVTDFLAKPVTRPDLLSALERSLGKQILPARRDCSASTASALPRSVHRGG